MCASAAAPKNTAPRRGHRAIFGRLLRHAGMPAYQEGAMNTDTSFQKAKPPKQKKPFRPFAWVTGSFAAGVAVILPFAITVAIFWAIVNFIDKSVVPMVLPLFPAQYQGLAKNLPGFGLIFSVIALTLAGALTANFIGRFIVRSTSFVFEKAPIVRSVYSSVKQIIETMANPGGQSFKESVLIEFPTPGQWSIGFITNDDCGEIETLAQDDVVAVYVPSSPIPTSGFWFTRRKPNRSACRKARKKR
jgi:uncharacterized membrane protein